MSIFPKIAYRLTKNMAGSIAISAFVVFVFLLQFVFNSETLERLDGIGYDAKLTLLSPLPESVVNIQIVDIDERSLFEIERMPWRRDLYAELTQKLTDMGAIVIAFDILFSEPQVNPAAPVINNLQETQALSKSSTVNVTEILEQFDYDATFARTITDKEVVLGTLLHRQAGLKKGQLKDQAVVQSVSSLTDKVTQYQGYAGVIDKLATKSQGLGFMNSVEDADGFVRRSALVAKVDGKLYPSLAAEAFRVYSLADKLEPVWQEQANQRFLEGVKIGNSLIQTDNQGRILVPFKGPVKTYPYTSAADIFSDKVALNKFDQAVVFVGTSASGLADLRVTPVTVNFPGVEIHATVFESLMSPGALVYKPDWWQGALALQLVLIALVVVSVLPRLGPVVMTLAAGIMMTMVVAANLALWRFQSIELPIVSPLLLAFVLSAYFIILGFFSESRRRIQVKAIFDQYVPPAHIERLLDTPEALSLDGEKKELSVMFSDIRSFTTISESMTAHELKKWLNQFFSPITQVIFQHDGTIDKYVGDMVMAFWGAPLDDSQHANKSIRAAFEMLRVLDWLNKDFADKKLPQASIGIGINTGEMNVGDMGSDYRRSYTVIGDAVNLGSRLEGLTKFYGLTLLVSEFTKRQATDYTFLLVDKVKVKGKLKPVTIYSPLPHNSSKLQRTFDQQYSEAIEAYFQQDFAVALSQFESIKDKFRYPILVTLYIERSRHWLAEPPDKSWDGSYTHTSK